VNKLNNPPQNQIAPIAANGAVLRSLDAQDTKTQSQIQQLYAALAKVSEPVTGNPTLAAQYQQQINGLKFSLDGIDPATGQKVQSGLNDQREKLRSTLQNLGAKLKPGATLSPSGQPGEFDILNSPEDEGLDNPDDPLYKVNTAHLQSVSAPAAPLQQGGQQAGLGVDNSIAPVATQAAALRRAASELGVSSASDPRVIQRAKQILLSQTQ
jgi:hypothetical protein